MDLNGFIQPSQTPTKATRAARGSYSKLICLNCRSRKIKCILPTQDESVQPSGSPQPADRACIRCQQQGLECIIDKTILGRPSSKRKQTEEQALSSSSTRKASFAGSLSPPSTIQDDFAAVDDFDVAGFVLAEVEDEIDRMAARLPKKDKPEDHEVYQALIDPYHLISTVIRRDKKFGSACNSALITADTDPMRYLRGPVIDHVEERLVWVRLYFPYIPSVSHLLREAVVPTVAALAPAVSTKALILVLTLIAIDARSSEPLPKQLDRDSVLAALARCGLELLFTPSTHRHTIYALELVMEYWPTALVTGQNAAAPSLKGELYVTLMKRIGDKLNIDAAPQTLRAKLTNPTAPLEEISQLVHDSLLWGRICYLEGSIGALITKSPADCQQIRDQLHEVTMAVGAAFEQYPHLSAASKFLYIRLLIRMSEVHAYGDIKAHRTDLDFLTTIKTSHFRTATEQKRLCKTLLERHKTTAEAPVIKDLVAFDIDCIHENVSQHVLAYGVMSKYLPPHIEPDMADVLKISDQIVDAVRLAILYHEPTPEQKDELMAGLAGFLARFGPSRPSEMCQHIKNIIKGEQKLVLNDVRWQPPSRETAACVLYQCKLLVEENAARMKGFLWLCEDVDTQLLLFEDCARALSRMDIQPSDDKPSALEQGSVISAAAKLMRNLGTIVAGWKVRLAEQQSRAVSSGSPPVDLGALEVILPVRDPTSPPVVLGPDTWRTAERMAMRHNPLNADERVASRAAPPQPQPQQLQQLQQQQQQQAMPVPLYNASGDIWDSTNLPAWSEVDFDSWAAWPQAVNLDFFPTMTHEDIQAMGQYQRFPF